MFAYLATECFKLPPEEQLDSIAKKIMEA